MPPDKAAKGLERLYGLFRRAGLVSEREMFMRGTDMRDHYDFSNSVKNPYAKKLKKSRFGWTKIPSNTSRILLRKKIFLIRA